MPRGDSTTSAPASMVARVALIVNAFDRAGAVLRLDQVADRTGLPRSSTHRILNQLHDAGLLQHTPDGYSLAASALPAAGAIDHAQLRSIASPVLERLHADTALIVHLGVLAGADVVYLDKVAGGGGAAVPTRVGGRTPAHASALGKTMLAHVRAEDIDKTLGKQLRKCTPSTIADLPTLHQELARIRSRRGIAYDDQELAVGLSSVAAPITMSGTEVAGLSLTGAVPAQHLARVAPFLSRSANGISGRLGSAAAENVDIETVTDDMLSRVLRTLASDAWV
ncbi:IclR family transcriptional regulator [Mycolicibacterium frederiksbergense]|uniref:IclR family transcriptional regulator n=1 Tax=Mycolicibacterium frederiksbergense TaxID=117567 RepID=UPI00265C7358|nr:IclR family transcriptional regulator [Mycolicibacterium frederiksbergense]MDO0972575.1 IclR family transcriptional regulator [Mycolicibacterium frederiksbergense]